MSEKTIGQSLIGPAIGYVELSFTFFKYNGCGLMRRGMAGRRGMGYTIVGVNTSVDA